MKPSNDFTAVINLLSSSHNEMFDTFMPKKTLKWKLLADVRGNLVIHRRRWVIEIILKRKLHTGTSPTVWLGIEPYKNVPVVKLLSFLYKFVYMPIKIFWIKYIKTTHIQTLF